MPVEKEDLLYPGIPALVLAIESTRSQNAFARAIGVPPGNVYNWLKRDHLVPLDRVPFIVAVAQHPDVTPLTLRPDYGVGWRLLAKQLGTCLFPIGSTDEECAALKA